MNEANSQKSNAAPQSVGNESEPPLDIATCRKNMSMEETMAFVESLLKVFRRIEDMSDLCSLYQVGKQLSRAYFDLFDYRPQMSELLLQLDFPQYSTKMMKKLNNMGVFKNDDIWFSSFYFYNINWNFSDTNYDFATVLGTAGLPHLLSLNIGHQPYLDNLSSKNVYYLLKASLSIIHNIVRVPGNAHFFNNEIVKNALFNLITREEEFIKCVSTLAIAYLIDENEKTLLDKLSHSIPNILKFIDKALKYEKRRFSGFCILEMLQALVALTASDSVKQAFVSEDGINIIKVLYPSEYEEEGYCVTKIFWNLTFDGGIRQRLLDDFDFMNYLAGIKALPNLSASISKNIDGCEWVIWNQSQRISSGMGDNLELKTTSSTAAAAAPSIFLSYSHSNKDCVLKVREKLRNVAMSVWIDVESIKGSSIEAMAEGIDSSLIFVVCISEAYKLSANCRMEAEYAIARKKKIVPMLVQSKYKPDGWLGFILGTQTYYDFSGRRDFSTSFESFTEALREIFDNFMLKNEQQHEESSPPLYKQEEEVKSEIALVDHTLLKKDSIVGGGVPEIQNSTSLDGSENNNIMVINMSNGYEGVTDDLTEQPQPPTAQERPHQQQQYNFIKTSIQQHQKSNIMIDPKIVSWSKENVADWLEQNKLQHLSHDFREIDGRLLFQLLKLRQESPDYFFNALESKLRMNLIDILMFCEASSKLPTLL